MSLNGTYNPKMFVMNQNILNNWRSVTDLYKEECRFIYNESYLGNNRDHGNYEITIRIDYTAPSNAITAPVKIFKRPNTVITINPAVTGTWKGTWGYADNSTTNFLSYQLNNDGTMLLLSQVGATEARGTYTFVNNILTASYSYLGGGAYSASGVFDASTGKLTGTWGRNSSATDGGKWVLIK